ncbi:glucose sorbosone dehydrogenase [Salinisphaera sp. PC39]|uniref:PQQ-dependent sugar dehydrogenase n=1 Tax=Salinisphaera sp. PC39 TaxID=1304156 RepID=UPI00333F4FD9
MACLLLAGMQAAVAQSPGFRLETVADGFANPWGLAFLPGGDYLVTERRGRLSRVHADGDRICGVYGVPEVAAINQGGLLDVALHPAFADNGWVYLSYAVAGEGGYATRVARGRLVDHTLEDLEVLITAAPFVEGGRHFGSRLLFHEGYLFVTTGDRGQKDNAQDLGKLHGKVLRLNPDGSIPADNPFVDDPGAHDAIYSYGHRNAQGIAVHPGTGRIWLHEHGPLGGDEINVLEAGANYGWPETTYGRAYSGERFAPEPPVAGYVSPIHHWTPSIAPSGMTFYTGDVFPAWRGDLFVGALRMTHLARLTLDGRKVVSEQRLLDDAGMRIRDVRQGPDGYLYLLVDAGKAPLLRLAPEN